MDEPESSESVKKSSRVSLTLDKKIQVIREQQNSGKSSRALASQFQCGKTQIDNILKRRHEWLEAYSLDPTATQKRKLRRTRNDEINILTYKWFKEATARMVPVTGSLLQEKALLFANQLGVTTFKGSNGWLDSFRKRHGISFNKTSCTSEATEDGASVDWNEELVKLCDGFLLRDVYVVCEMNIYFKASTDFAMFVAEKDASEGVDSSKQVTVMMCANALGEKEDLVVIGESDRFHAQYNLEFHTFPVDYHHSKSAHMTSTIFENWLKRFNRKMAVHKRKVLLLVEETPQHPHCHLDNVLLKFLPIITASSIVWPLDDNVIQVVKLKFRTLQLRYIVRKLVVEKEKSGLELLKDTSLLDTIYWLHQAWSELDPKHISTCFHKAGFKGIESYVKDTGEEGPESMEIENQLCQDILGISIQEFIDLDSVLEACAMECNDGSEEKAERTREFSPPTQDRPGDDYAAEPPPVSPYEAFDCIQKLKSYFLQNGESLLFDTMMDVEKKADESIFEKFKVARQACLAED